MKKLALMAVMVFAVTAAWAQDGNNGNGQGGCGVGQQTNGCGTPGGQGGSGGAGGNASAIGNGGQGGIGTGGSVASSGNSANSNRNTNSNAGNNSSQAIQVGGNSYQSNYRAATSTAYAPPIAPTSMCMGSSSAGGSGMTFGFSIGTSWTDSNCQLLEQVRTVAVALADKETAAAMMCTVEAYREARKNTGNPCKTL